jgi:glutamate-1-semialdehyde aminotransferase
VLKFEGGYPRRPRHGAGLDQAAGAKVGHARHPKALPVGQGSRPVDQNTLVATWNDSVGVREILERNQNQVGAIIIEP